MYEKLSVKNKWKFEVMEVSETSVGGYKEAQANILGNGVFGRLKFESGVHRVQRIPPQKQVEESILPLQPLLFFLRLRIWKL